MEINSKIERSYTNRDTGETTTDHEIAMNWYRAGCVVECYRNGRLAITLLM